MGSFFIYMGLAIVTAIFAKLSLKEEWSKKVRILCIIITILLPSVLAGIRYGIGTDYDIHEKVFNQIANGEEVTKRTEFGYALFNKIIAIMGGNYNVVLFFVTLISMTCIYFTLVKYKDKINVPIAIFAYMLLYYQLSYNLIRQMFSASIALYGTTYLMKNQKWKFIAICILASTIHVTSLIYLILLAYPFLTEEKYKKPRLITYAILAILVFTYPYIILPILHQIEKVIPALEYFVNYLEVKYETIGLGIFRYILLLIAPGITVYQSLKKDKNMMAYFQFCIIGFIIWLTSYVTKMEFYRLSYSVLLSLIILIGYYWNKISLAEITLPQWIEKLIQKLPNIIQKYEMPIIKVMYLCLIAFFWYYDYFYLEANETIPYITIFQK